MGAVAGHSLIVVPWQLRRHPTRHITKASAYYILDNNILRQTHFLIYKSIIISFPFNILSLFIHIF